MALFKAGHPATMPALLVLTVLLSAAATPIPVFADEFRALDRTHDVEIVTISDKTYALALSLVYSAVQIIDVTDPANPLPVAALFDGQDGFVLANVIDITSVAIDGRVYALVTSMGMNTVQIVDVTDPANPFPVTEITESGSIALDGPMDVAILDTSDRVYALVANRLGSSVQIIDITDPANPFPVASVFDDQGGFDVLGGARSISLVEISDATYALVVAQVDDAVQIIDITDPANPFPVASIVDDLEGFDALANADRIAVMAISENVYALVTSNTDDAVQIINITDPDNPLPAASVFDGDPWPNVSGGNFTLNGPGGIVTFEAGGGVYALLAVTGDSAVQVLDVTDPTNPLHVISLSDGEGGFDALGGAYGVALVPKEESIHALVASYGDSAVQVLDVTDPIDPLLAAGIFDDDYKPTVVVEDTEVDASVMAQTRFDVSSIENRAQDLVAEMAVLYQANDTVGIAELSTHGIHTFILDAETMAVEAYGMNPDLVGTVPESFMEADKSVDGIRAELDQNQNMWLNHMWTHPDTGIDKLLRSWLYVHDGHIFGAGYFVHDSEVQAVVDGALRKYEAGGADAFDAIASGMDGHYPFVLDAATAQPVAYGGNFADIIADRLLSGTKPYPQIIADLNRDGYAWVSYVFPNTGAHIPQLQRTWLVLHDGYIFASGYHLPDSRIQSLVEGAILLYRSNGDDAFEMITPDSPSHTDALYPFVLEFDTSVAVAHGAFPDKLGAVPVTSLHQGDRPWSQIQEELRQDGSAWVSYVFTNPDTRTDQLKRAYLQLHDDYIFASGYYLPDARVQTAVDEAIFAFHSLGVDSFAILNSAAESIDPNDAAIFATVMGVDGSVLASNAPTNISITQTHGLVVTTDKPFFELFEDLAADGYVWFDVVQLHHATVSEQLSRVMMVPYGNYIFVSGYFLPDSEVQSTVDKAVFSYVVHGQAAFDMITPEMPKDTDAVYVFVMDFDTSVVVAHGASPHLVGAVQTTSLHAGAKPWSQIQEELLADGGTWTSYTFTNPATNIVEDKRAWLYLRDGYVFAAGYYVEEARVQALVRNAMHAYTAYSADAFSLIDAIADGEKTVQLYPFVIDPETLEILAQGIGSEGAGTDLAAITDADRTTDEILAALDGTSGTWSVYEAVNPLTGETELKRSWLSTHGDYIFGVGYYDLCLDIDAPNCAVTPAEVQASVNVVMVEGSAYPNCAETDNCFDPHTIMVEPGTAVTWTNSDHVLHTVTESVPDPAFNAHVNIGEEFTHTFDEPGTYTYGCTIHPWASGVVVVGLGNE